MAISSFLPLPSLQCLSLHIIFWSLHSMMSLTSSPSSLLITCPYHLNLTSLTFSAMYTTPHFLLIPSSSLQGAIIFAVTCLDMEICLGS
jgi:hypothetical protein